MSLTYTIMWRKMTVLSWPQLIERKTQVNSEDFIIYSFIAPGRDTVTFFIYKNVI